MTEEKIFVNKLFLSLNISDFSLLLCKYCITTWKISPHLPQWYLSKNCDHVKPPSNFLKIYRRFNPQQKWRGSHYVFLTYSTDLRPEKLLIFGLQLCPINHKNCRSWNSRPTFFWEKFGIISWNRLIIFNIHVKYVLLISFLVQNLITSDNPISMRLRWIWNSVFWLEVENLRKLEIWFTTNPFPVSHRKTEKPFPRF